MADLPIRKVLQKPDVAGRMVRWAVELSEFDIHYEPRGPIKGLIYADFVMELSSATRYQEGADFWGVLSVDGSSNQQGSGTGVILEGPNGLLIEQALRFVTLWEADEPIHGHPSQSAHKELASHGIRTAYQHHLRVERSKVCLRSSIPLKVTLGPENMLRIAASRIACENGVENSLGGVAVSGSSTSPLSMLPLLPTALASCP